MLSNIPTEELLADFELAESLENVLLPQAKFQRLAQQAITGCVILESCLVPREALEALLEDNAGKGSVKLEANLYRDLILQAMAAD